MSYIDIRINEKDNTFCIVESDVKPKTHDCAQETLAKIEKVFKENLTYNSIKEDKYSNLSKDELNEFLMYKSYDIYDGYHKKQEKLNWFVRFLFSQDTKILNLYKKVSSSLPNYFHFMPRDLNQQINNSLNDEILRTLALVNKQQNEQATITTLHRARTFGYQGNDRAEASKYVGNLREMFPTYLFLMILKLLLFQKMKFLKFFQRKRCTCLNSLGLGKCSDQKI